MTGYDGLIKVIVMAVILGVGDLACTTEALWGLYTVKSNLRSFYHLGWGVISDQEKYLVVAT